MNDAKQDKQDTQFDVDEWLQKRRAEAAELRRAAEKARQERDDLKQQKIAKTAEANQYDQMADRIERLLPDEEVDGDAEDDR